MRKLYEGGAYSPVDHLLVTLALSGYLLKEKTKILDLGCGEGWLVYEFRRHGYDAYGFDVYNRVKYENEGDEKYFKFSQFQSESSSNFNIDWDSFRIPFDDEHFDFVFSTSVLEHVQNHEMVMREVSRVLKKGGISLHNYPPRHIFIEPHIYVPFGSLFNQKWYFRLFALLGIRNEYQQGMSSKAVAEANRRYSKSGIKYIPHGEMVSYCDKYFTHRRLIPQNWNYNSGILLRCLLMSGTFREKIYSKLKWVVLLLEK